MANRLDYFFRQTVTEAELDEGFDKMEQAILDVMADQLLIGIWTGAVASQHSPTADLTIDLTGPAIGRDKDGNRLFYSPAQNPDLSIDENGTSTAVATGGNEKTLSVFWAFERALSDPRTDGNANTVFFQRAESFALKVVQSAEAAIGTSTPPALRVDQILLCDVVIVNAQTQILNADIDISRREDVFVLTGSPYSVTTGRVHDALQDMLDNLNTIANGGAASIGYAGGGNWADATTNPAVSVEAQLDKIITDLAGAAGTAKIQGIVSANPNPILTATDLAAQLTELESEAVDGTKHGQLTFFGNLLAGHGEGAWGINSSSGWPTWELSGATGDFLFLPIIVRLGDELELVSFSYQTTDVNHDVESFVVKIDQHPTGAPITETFVSGSLVSGGSATTVGASHSALAHAVDSSNDLYFLKIRDSDVGVTLRRVRNFKYIVNRKAA
jgi:hypothetical protein